MNTSIRKDSREDKVFHQGLDHLLACEVVFRSKSDTKFIKGTQVVEILMKHFILPAVFPN